MWKSLRRKEHKMRKSEFRGWTEVFRFTLSQTWKNRSFLIFMIIMWVICFAAVPVLSAFTGTKKQSEEEYSVEKTSIEKVYILDELGYTDLGLKTDIFKEKSVFANVVTERVPCLPLTSVDQELDEKTFKDLCDKVNNEPHSVIVHVYVSPLTGITFDIVRAIESKVGEKECDYIGSLLVDEFNRFKYVVTEMGDEQMAALDYKYEVVALLEQEDGTFISEQPHISEGKYWVVYAILFAIMMIVTTSSSQVATAVAMDKSTKVMEYLLTSIRPMALVFGKVVASVVSTVLQITISFVLALASNLLTKQATGTDFLKAKLPGGIMENITLPNFLIAIVGVAAGVMFYGFVAGLCGAMVRKLEEMQESMSLLVILTLIGAYLAMFASMSMQKSLSNPLFYAAMFVPISAPFLLPGVCIVGAGALWLRLVSLAVILLLDVIVLFISARIYEILIMYNGNKIKLKDLGKFLKQAKGGRTI